MPKPPNLVFDGLAVFLLAVQITGRFIDDNSHVILKEIEYEDLERAPQL